MSEDRKKSNDDENENCGMTAKELAGLYNTTEGKVWQETRNNGGNYMGMWYDSGDGKFYRK
jgi:hypothetical protein